MNTLGSFSWENTQRFFSILSGKSDANIRFSDLVRFLLRLGFDERIRGDHHIFTKKNIEEIVNLQPKNSMVKPYPVKQVRNVILKYELGVGEDEQIRDDHLLE